VEEEGKSVPKLDVQLVNLLLINLEKVMHKLQLKVEKGDEEKVDLMEFDSLEMKIVILERLEICKRNQSRKKSQKRVIVDQGVVDLDLEIGDGLNKSGEKSGFYWFKIP
jgi:hypothetical protein